MIQKKVRRDAQKEKAKVAAELVKLGADPSLAGLASPTTKEDGQSVQFLHRLASLEQAVNRNAQIHRRNANEFQQAFAIIDEHLHITQKVINDIVADDLTTSPMEYVVRDEHGEDVMFEDGDGRMVSKTEKRDVPCWDAYRLYYRKCVEFDLFIRWLRFNIMDRPEAKAPEQEMVAVPEYEPSDVVFGG